MARKFLTPIDLNKLELQNARIQNLTSDPASPVAGQIYYNSVDSQLKYYNGSASAWQVIGQSIEQLEDAVADLLAAGTAISLDYSDETGTLTIANTGVTSILGTANEVEVSASAGAVTISLPSSINADTTGNANTATTLQNARTISLGGDLSGSASFNGSTDITITATVGANSVALGTDTTGDYVAGATAGSGITVDGSGGEGSSLTITNTGVLSLTGTANEVNVSASAGNVTIGLPDDVTIGGSLTVTGDLTVSGSTTYLNTATLQVEDNKVVLNSNATGTPTVDAGIEIERGDFPNAELFWDESEGKWTSNNGSASYALSLEGHTHTSSDITNFQEAVEDVVGSLVTDSGTIDFTYTDNSASAGTLSASVILAASASYLSTTSGLAVDKSALETVLLSDGFTRKVSANLTGVATSYAITHNLGTRDVTVNVYDNATYDTVETDVVRTDANIVTISFAVAPTSNAYRVVIVG
jgi:hypothetical protein